MPGISCNPASRMSFLRSLRCEPMTKRCASSRSRWMKYKTGSRGSSLRGSRSGMNRGSLPGWPFCHGRQPDLAQSEASENLAGGIELTAAAIDDDEIGPLWKRVVVRPGLGRIALGRGCQEPLEAALQSAARHSVV